MAGHRLGEQGAVVCSFGPMAAAAAYLPVYYLPISMAEFTAALKAALTVAFAPVKEMLPAKMEDSPVAIVMSRPTINRVI